MNIKPTGVSTISCQVVDKRVIALAEENKKAIESLRRYHLELSNRVSRYEERFIFGPPKNSYRSSVFNHPRTSENLPSLAENKRIGAGYNRRLAAGGANQQQMLLEKNTRSVAHLEPLNLSQ